MLRISKCVSWGLQIPMLSVSCYEAMTLVIKPCALIPNLVHTCCTLVPGMLYYPSHGTDCPKHGKVLRLPLRSYCLYNQISQFRFDTPTQSVSCGPLWYFVRWGSPVLTSFPLDQTNWFFKLLDLYSSQRFCEQVRRVILPWDVTDRDSLVFDLFLYIMVTNVHMFDPCLLCRICC